MTAPARPAAASIRPPRAADYRDLLLLSCLWGSSFVAIKQAVSAGLPPLSLATLRIGIGAALLIGVALWKGQAWPRGRRVWRQIVFLAIVGNALPFFLIAWGEQFTTSQLAGIMMATIPLLVILLAHAMTADEKLTPGKIVGVILGFLGILILIGADALQGLGSGLLGQGAIFVACLSYSLYGVNTRRLPPLGAEMLIASTLIVAFLLLLPIWLVLDRPWSLDPAAEAIGAVLWLGCLSTGIGNLLFFVILRRVGAGFPANNNFLVPIFALAYGFLWLGERPGWNALIALAFVLAGLAVQRFWPAHRALQGAGETTGAKPRTSRIE